VPADLAERTVGNIVGPIGSDQRAIFALATKHGVQVRHLRPSVPTLEDVFAKAIGEE
jgi:hypothetical protein